MKLIKSKLNLKLIAVALVALGLFFGGYITKSSSGSSGAGEQTSQQNKNYYISFDDYYYEVPKGKTVDDRLVADGQFLYNLNTAIKTNTLNDLFDGGAIGVQAQVPLNSDSQAFDRYIDTAVKPSAASSFGGTADVKFSDRGSNKIRTAEVTSSKSGAVVRRQYIVNLPQSVLVVAKDDSEAFRDIGKNINQASAKFSDYESMKLQVLAEVFMIKNRMFDDIYRLAHDDLRSATSVDELTRIGDQSKDTLSLEAKVPGVKLFKKEMTATIYFNDSTNPAKNKTGTLIFHQSAGKWKLFALRLPNGTVTGTVDEGQN